MITLDKNGQFTDLFNEYESQVLAPDAIATTTLSALEAQADYHLENFTKAYWQLTECLVTIRDTGAWTETEYPSYEAYLQARWLPMLNIGKSRLRQLEAAYNVMQIVSDVTGRVLNESQVRSLKQVVPPEKYYLLSEIVSRVFTYTSSPAKRHWQAVYEVLLQRERDAIVSVGGIDLPVDSTQASVLEAVLEADKRRNEHISTNSKWTILNRYEYRSAADARDAFNNLAELQAIDSDTVIVVQVRRLKTIDMSNDNVTEVTE